MARYIIHARFIHPTTGLVHMPGVPFDPKVPDAACQEVDLPDDFEPSVWFKPLDMAAVKAKRALLEKRKAAKQNHQVRVDEKMKAGASLTEARHAVAEEMIYEANSQSVDIDAMMAELDQYEKNNKKFLEEKAALEKAQKSVNKVNRPNERSVIHSE